MRKILSLLTAILFAGSMMADVAELQYTGGTTTNMVGDGTNNAATVGLDATLFTVLADKGSNQNLPGLNQANDIRLYADKNSGDGNSITVSIASGSITSIALDIKQTATFEVKAGETVVTEVEGAYAINGSSFSVQNTTTGATTQLRLNKITINYTTGSGEGGEGGDEPETRTIYLNGGGASLWNQADAVFFIHAWGGTEADVIMAQVEGDVYSASIPADNANLCFVRMAPGSEAINWETRWNQSTDQTIPADKNLFTMTSWDNGTWSVYGEGGDDPVEPTLANGFYLIGQNGWTVAALNADLKFAVHESDEYVLTATLAENDPIKVVKVENDVIVRWYPDGEGTEYTVDAAHAGEKDIYFQEAYKADWAEFGGYIWMGENAPAPVADFTQPFTLKFNGTGKSGSDASGAFAADVAAIFDAASAPYVASVETATKIYAGRPIADDNSSVKFGTTSAKGSFAFTLAQAIEVDSIIVNATQYGNNAAKVTVNSVEFDLNAGNKVPQDCKITPEDNVSAITVAQSGTERIYVRYVKVYPHQGGDTPEPPTPAEKDSIYFVNVAGWDAPRVHLWGGTAEATTWPGAEMVKLDEQINGFDVYKFVADEDAYAKCVFSNNGADEGKSADQDWTSGEYFYDGAWYEKEEIPAPAPTKYYAKYAPDWAWVKLTEKEGMWLTDTIVYGGIGININDQAADEHNMFYSNTVEEEGVRPIAGAEIAEKDTIYFSFNPADSVVTAVMVGKYVAPVPHYYIAGTMTDWAAHMVEMEAGNVDTFHVALALEADSLYSFKVVKILGTDTTWYGNKEEGTMVYGNSTGWWLNGDANIGLQTTKAGEYQFIFKANENNEISVVIPEPDKEYYAKYAPDWAWVKLTEKEGMWLTDTIVYGGIGININDQAADENNMFYSNTVDEEGVRPIAGAEIAENDTLYFTFNPADSVVTAVMVGKYVEPTYEFEDGYYLVGNKYDWAPAAERLFTANAENEGEFYLVDVTLAAEDSIKVVYVEKDVLKSWYPEGNNYVVDAAHAGVKTIYFNPTVQEAWGGNIYIEANPAPKFYITGDAALVGEDLAWNPAAIASMEDEYEMTLAAGAYKMKITVDGKWETAKGVEQLTTRAAGVQNLNGNIGFILAEETTVKVTYTGEVFTLEGNFVQTPIIKTYMATGAGWTGDDESSAVYDAENQVVTINLVQSKQAQWQAQVWYQGPEVKADKYYDVSFKMQSNHAVNGVIAKYQESNEMFFDNTIALEENVELTYSKTNLEGKVGNNVLAFDFGFAPAGTVITISEIAIVEKDAPEYTLTDGYYLIGRGGWDISALTPDLKLTLNPDAEGGVEEYTIEANLVVGDEFQIVKVENDAIGPWFPGGEENNYLVDADHAGAKTIYFRPNYNGGDDWHHNCIFVPANEPIVYCELPSGHLGQADFGDPSGRILLTIAKGEGNNLVVKIKNNNEAGNPQTGLNFLWVNATGATNNNATYGSHEAENVEEVSVIVEFDEAKETYHFNNIHWAYAGWTGEWAIDGLDVAASELCEEEEPIEYRLENGFYLISEAENWDVANVTAAMKFETNPDNEAEFVLTATFAEGDKIKVVKVVNDAIAQWYPDGEGTEYTVDAAHAGEKDIYFQEAYKADWSEFGGYFWMGANPIEYRLENGFYLISEAENWDVANVTAAMKFEANPDNEAEFVLTATFAEGDKIKVVKVENDAIAQWYPDGEGTEYTVDANHAGANKDIYFQEEYKADWSEFGGYFWIGANDASAILNAEAENVAVKLLQNGQVIIRRGERVYTIMGQLIK